MNAGRPRAWAAAATPALAAVLALALAGPATAATRGAAHQDAAAHRTASRDVLRLHPMPAGTVRFGRRHGRLTVHAALSGLTPGSLHDVDLRLPWHGMVRFSTLTANAVGQARATLSSHYTGALRPDSRLVIRMGTGSRGVAADPIALTRWLGGPRRVYRLRAVEAGTSGRGPLRGHAVLVYHPSRHTLTVTVSASGLTPGPHAAHIHLGSCQRQGPVAYMLRDLMAGPRGRVVHAVRTFRHVMTPIPARGWYLNLHQGSSATILRNGQPTIFFRPLLCANIH